jgi:hypothetical protein
MTRRGSVGFGVGGGRRPRCKQARSFQVFRSMLVVNGQRARSLAREPVV